MGSAVGSAVEWGARATRIYLYYKKKPRPRKGDLCATFLRTAIRRRADFSARCYQTSPRRLTPQINDFKLSDGLQANKLYRAGPDPCPTITLQQPLRHSWTRPYTVHPDSLQQLRQRLRPNQPRNVLQPADAKLARPRPHARGRAHRVCNHGRLVTRQPVHEPAGQKRAQKRVPRPHAVPERHLEAAHGAKVPPAVRAPLPDVAPAGADLDHERARARAPRARDGAHRAERVRLARQRLRLGGRERHAVGQRQDGGEVGVAAARQRARRGLRVQPQLRAGGHRRAHRRAHQRAVAVQRVAVHDVRLGAGHGVEHGGGRRVFGVARVGGRELVRRQKRVLAVRVGQRRARRKDGALPRDHGARVQPDARGGFQGKRGEEAVAGRRFLALGCDVADVGRARAETVRADEGVEGAAQLHAGAGRERLVMAHAHWV